VRSAASSSASWWAGGEPDGFAHVLDSAEPARVFVGCPRLSSFGTILPLPELAPAADKGALFTPLQSLGLVRFFSRLDRLVSVAKLLRRLLSLINRVERMAGMTENFVLPKSTRRARMSLLAAFPALALDPIVGITGAPLTSPSRLVPAPSRASEILFQDDFEKPGSAIDRTKWCVSRTSDTDTIEVQHGAWPNTGGFAAITDCGDRGGSYHGHASAITSRVSFRRGRNLRCTFRVAIA
jgi:hypothetical protein